MGATFVLMLREGLEASLIVGVLFAFLNRIGRSDQARNVWLGVSLAILASFGAAALLLVTSTELEGRAEEVFEGVAALLAVVFLTWMVFWMRRHAIDFKKNLTEKMSSVLDTPGAGLLLLAFVVVLREGIESALFFFATAQRVGRAPGIAGALLGIATAVILGAGIARGGIKLNLTKFFTITGVFLLVVAGGLAAHAISELIEAGFIPAGVKQVWDTSNFLPDGTGPGLFLKQLFGYHSNPALTELAAWAVYLGTTSFLFFRPFWRIRKGRQVTIQSA